MIFRLLSLVSLFLISTVAADDDAARDVALGLQGLIEASKDPAALAQLMQDLNDPELMAEAQKLTQGADWQKRMKEVTESKEFKESFKKTADMLKDPNTAAQAEAKFEHMQRVGQDRLKEAASSDMETIMASLSNPDVMAQMTGMLKDPKFKEQLAAMTKDPQMQNYMAAMQDMMKDPKAQEKLKAATEAIRASL